MLGAFGSWSGLFYFGREICHSCHRSMARIIYVQSHSQLVSSQSSAFHLCDQLVNDFCMALAYVERASPNRSVPQTVVAIRKREDMLRLSTSSSWASITIPLYNLLGSFYSSKSSLHQILLAISNHALVCFLLLLQEPSTYRKVVRRSYAHQIRLISQFFIIILPILQFFPMFFPVRQTGCPEF